MTKTAMTTATLALRQNNRRRIFQFIYNADQPVTKQDIAQKLGLSLPTVSGNLTDFLKEGLLAYSGTLESTGGRRPRAITLVEDAKFGVGISIMDDAVRLVAVDLCSHELAYRKLRQPFVNQESYYKSIAAELERFLDDNRLDRTRLLGVGITIPGIVDWEKKLVVFAPTLDLRDKRLAELMALCPYPVNIENDANASCFAEWWWRTDLNNMAYLSIERGVGGAILLGGRSYTGDHSRSAEFGHFCILPEGRPCRCGKRGCFEAYCSTSRLSDDLGITLEEFFAMLKGGNQQIALTWDAYLKNLARGIANIRVIFDCDIVLGGMLGSFMNEHMEELRAQTALLTSFDTDGGFLRLSRYKSHSACVGAALHFVRDFIRKI